MASAFLYSRAASLKLMKISLKCFIHSDGWKGYDGLINAGYDRHLRVNKSKSFVEHSVHIMNLKNFGVLQSADWQSSME